MRLVCCCIDMTLDFFAFCLLKCCRMQDLFPHLDISERSTDRLVALIDEAAVEQHLRPTVGLTDKCLQLRDTLRVRFGVMLVGGAAGGKSSIHKTLALALNKSAESAADSATLATEVHTLNPKVFSLGQLYGQYSQLTGDWKDGIGSAICRKALEACKGAQQWVIFDGPVDPLWIESMNTVLDDNCMLCLPSGERMKLHAGAMRVLFETEELNSASPATVSRCGMVYVPQAALTWETLVEQVLADLPALLGLDGVRGADEEDAAAGKTLAEQLFVDLEALAQKFLPQGVLWLQAQAAEHVPATVYQRIKAFRVWLGALIHSCGDWDHAAPYGPAEKAALSYVFAFAFVWSLGGNLSGGSRDAWDKFVRELFYGVANFPPGAGSVYDFCCDPERNFTFKVRTHGLVASRVALLRLLIARLTTMPLVGLQTWKEALPSFTYVAEQPVEDVFVPTADSVCLSWFLSAAQLRHDSVLFVGPSGCGKTASIKQALQREQELGRADTVCLTLSAETSSDTAQQMIEVRLEKKSRTCWGSSHGKRLALFVDDVNMPKHEEFGAQPALELLRSLQACLCQLLCQHLAALYASPIHPLTRLWPSCRTAAASTTGKSFTGNTWRTSQWWPHAARPTAAGSTCPHASHATRLCCSCPRRPKQCCEHLAKALLGASCLASSPQRPRSAW